MPSSIVVVELNFMAFTFKSALSQANRNFAFSSIVCFCGSCLEVTREHRQIPRKFLRLEASATCALTSLHHWQYDNGMTSNTAFERKALVAVNATRTCARFPRRGTWQPGCHAPRRRRSQSRAATRLDLCHLVRAMSRLPSSEELQHNQEAVTM